MLEPSSKHSVLQPPGAHQGGPVPPPRDAQDAMRALVRTQRHIVQIEVQYSVQMVGHGLFDLVDKMETRVSALEAAKRARM